MHINRPKNVHDMNFDLIHSFYPHEANLLELNMKIRKYFISEIIKLQVKGTQSETFSVTMSKYGYIPNRVIANSQPSCNILARTGYLNTSEQIRSQVMTQDLFRKRRVLYQGAWKWSSVLKSAESLQHWFKWDNQYNKLYSHVIIQKELLFVRCMHPLTNGVGKVSRHTSWRSTCLEIESWPQRLVHNL